MLPQLDISVYSSQLFWLVICISMLILLLNKLFIPRLNCALEKRETFFKQECLDVESLESKICEMNKQIKDIENHGNIKSSEIIRKAILKSEENFENRIRNLKDENEELLGATRNRIHSDIKNLEDNIKQQINLSIEVIFQKFVGGS